MNDLPMLRPAAEAAEAWLDLMILATTALLLPCEIGARCWLAWTHQAAG